MNGPENDPTGAATPRELQPGRCGARKRDGNPCRIRPMRGTNRCRLHGGASPQAQRKARERIRDAADHAAAALIGFMNNAEVPWPTRLAAARDLLDRADVTGRTIVELEVKPWQVLLQGIDSTPPGGTPEIAPLAVAEIEAHNAAERDDGIVDAELVEHDEDEPMPDNVRPLPARAGTSGPAPLQSHAERYGDHPAAKGDRKRPRVAGHRQRGPRDGR